MTDKTKQSSFSSSKNRMYVKETFKVLCSKNCVLLFWQSENIENNKVLHYKRLLLNFSWWIAFGVICTATFLTRFYKVLEPDHVW